MKKLADAASKMTNDAMQQAPELANSIANTTADVTKKVSDAGSGVVKKGRN